MATRAAEHTQAAAASRRDRAAGEPAPEGFLPRASGEAPRARSRGALAEFLVRGVLAESLVARAVGALPATKREWDVFELRTPTGVRIEVKAAGLWEGWPQPRLARIAFSALAERDAEDEAADASPADVYVFAIHLSGDAIVHDPLDDEQWEFRVVSARVIAGAGATPVDLRFLNRVAPERLHECDLADAIERAADGPGRRA